MSAIIQPSLVVRRKALPGHSYTAIPQLSSLISKPVSTSSSHELRRTCSCEGISCECSHSLRQSQVESLLQSSYGFIEPSTKLSQTASENRTPQLQVDRSSIANHATFSEKPSYRCTTLGDNAWNPFWLRRTVLFAFCVLYLSLVAALVVLYYFARKNNGISTQISSNHYYWTYGPTTVLMLVIALWRQVDYSCRLLIPWQDLASRQGAMRMSLLLDYVSPVLATTMFRTIKSRHWCVVSSLSGFMLLKVVTVVSTGLLVLSSTQLSDHQVGFQTSSVISTRGRNSSNYPSVDSVLNYYGVLNNDLPYPQGTTSTGMFELVHNTEKIPHGSVFEATVPGFYPKFACQVATVHNNSGLPPRSGIHGFDDNDSSSFAYAVPFNVSLGGDSWEVTLGTGTITFCNPAFVVCPPRIVSTFDLRTTWSKNVSTTPWLLIANDVRYNQTISPTLNKTALLYGELEVPSTINVTEWSVHIERTTAVLCNIGYSIEDTQLHVDTAQEGTSHYVQAKGPLTRTNDHLDDYTDVDLMYDFLDLLMFSIPDAFPKTVDGGPSMFDLMSKLDLLKDDSSYLKPDILTGVSASAFEMLLTQVSSEILRTPGKKTVTGTINYFENRLHVKPLSFWVMLAGFTIMFGITLLTYTTRPQAFLPQDPASIASCACILTSRMDISGRLSTLGRASDIALKQNLSSPGFKVRTTTTAIHTSVSRSMTESVQEEGPQKTNQRFISASHQSWRPFAASSSFQIASLAVLCATITILAVLQRVSDANDGVANVDSKTFMLLMATLCTSASFAVITVSPYYNLTRGDAKAEHTVLLDVCGKSPVVVVYKSLRRLLVAPALISLALILSSFLTIVVSGLYTTVSVPLPRPVTIDQFDQLDKLWDSTVTDNNAMTILELLEHSNASFPSFTYGELTIPAVEVPEHQDTVMNALNDNAEVYLTVSLPVRRGSLNCTLIPREDFAVVEHPYNNISGTCEELSCGLATAGSVPDATFDVNAKLASYCRLPGHFNEKSTVNYSLQLNYPPLGYNGGIQSLSGCPSPAFTLGYLSTNTSAKYFHQDTTDKDNVTTLVCSQYLEESITDVHFLLPSLSINTARPPIFNTSNSHIVSTTQYNITSWLSQLSNYPLYGFGRPSIYAPTPVPLDTFTQIILSGTSGIPVEELIRPANAERLIDAVQHIYRLYIAQAINANMRQNFSSPTKEKRVQPTSRAEVGPKVLNATLLDPTRMRLVQNRASAIVLEVLLGLILVLSIAAYSTTRLKGILPHNPCSIAGMMSLLAGSRLIDSKTGILPEGADLWTEKEREATFKKWRFGLCWWDGEEMIVGNGKDDTLRFGIDVSPPKEPD